MTNRRPTVRPVGSAARPGGGSDSPVHISPDTVPGQRPHLNAKRERIMLGGDTNSGKSYVWIKMADRELREARDEGREPKRFYVIDTDDTSPSFMGPGEDFEHLYFENGGNVYPYPAFNWGEIAGATGTILRAATAGDWIIADVLNRFYDDAQDELADRRGYNLDDKAIGAGLAPTPKGFNGVEPGDWIMIRRIHDAAFKRFIFQGTQAHFMGLVHLTEVSDVAGRERREVLTTFDEIGLKPMGAPRAPGAMDTIVFLWSKRIINRDERNRRVGQAFTQRFMSVIKDRGHPYNIQAEYGDEMYEQLKEIRRSQRKPANITQAEIDSGNFEQPQMGPEIATRETEGEAKPDAD